MTDEEKRQLRAKYGITPEDEKSYVLPEEKDYEILAKIKQLKAKDLSEEDREVVSFICTQLFDDWRTPIIEKLENLERKYQ